MNGTGYNIQLKAINSVGSSATAAIFSGNPVTPTAGITVPGAPTGLSATPGDATIALSWTAPANNGGALVTNYSYSTDGGTTFKAFAPANAGTSATITTTSLTPFPALVNGTAYNIQLKAINSAGSSATAAIFSGNPVTPAAGATVPGTPRSLGATPGNRTIALTWAVPTSNGGADITNYSYSTDNGVTFKPFTPASTATSATLERDSSANQLLVNGTEYNIRLKAINSVGSSATAAIFTGNPVTPRTVPDAPTGLSATPGDVSISLTWTAPASNGGADITNYEYSTDGGSTFRAFSNPSVTGTTATISLSSEGLGLENGTDYNIQLKAINAAGSSEAAIFATPVTPRTVPGAPTGCQRRRTTPLSI